MSKMRQLEGRFLEFLITNKLLGNVFFRSWLADNDGLRYAEAVNPLERKTPVLEKRRISFTTII